MPYLIRHAVADDIPALVVLLHELFSIEQDFSFDKQKQTTALELLVSDSRCCIYVAEQDANVIGMCTLQTLVSTAEGGYVGLIEDVVISKDHRWKGVGKLLLTEIENWSKQQGLLRLQLLADRSNTDALSFYHALAWSKTSMIALRKLLPDSDND
jgi:GNAT superfamily N-acetyltransferase